jgi:hypothetical protein
MNGRLVTTALAALSAAACSPQSDNGQRDAAMGDPVAPDRQPLVDTCAVARHSDRFHGQRVRLRALLVQDIESAYLTSPHCMWRTRDGKVWIDDNKGGGDFSTVDATVMEARRRSTATRTFAAEAEFEGIVRAQRQAIARNEIRPMAEFVAMIEVDKIDHVRLVEIPVLLR